MQAPLGSPTATLDLNQLRPGVAYTVITADGATATGTYRGIEVGYGQWRILLEHASGTDSIPVRTLEAAFPTAA